MKSLSAEMMTELEYLVERNGGTITPQIVVEAARKEKSVLHSYFDWNDTTAAFQYRLEQARRLIRTWVYILPQKPQRPMRVMVSLSEDRGEDGYRRLADVMGDVELREKLLIEAKRDMSYFRRKYAMLSELAEVFAAMDKVN